MEKQKSVWGKYECKPGNAYQFSGGCCSFAVKRVNGGWQLSNAEKRKPTEKPEFKPLEEGFDDSNYNFFQTGRSDQLLLAPAMPVKPVVFKTAKQIRISPHQTMRLFLVIPCNVQLYFSNSDPSHLLTEHEMMELPNTWFGEPDLGEAAFSIGDSYSLQLETIETQKFEVICPVKINNTSHIPMELQRFLVHVENLNIYKKGNQLITNLVSIDFKGSDQISNILYGTDKTIHGENPALIAKARNSGSKNILGKSFHFIKHFTQ